MVGTAAEVTPIREVDDHVDRPARPGHARDPAGVPRHGARAQRPLVRSGSSTRRRPRPRREAGGAAGPALGAVRRRARGGARARGAALRAGSRSGRRSTASRRRSPRRSARRTRRPSRREPPACTCSAISAGIGPGDEVITSPYSFAASANCFIYEGGVPVFADVDPRTLNLDPAAVEAAVTPRTKAIVASTSTATRASSTSCARSRRGTASRSSRTRARRSARSTRARSLGSHGAAAVFAFYPNKQITTGEGGWSRRTRRRSGALLRSLRNQGRGDEGGWLEHVRLGFNYRLDDIARRARRSASSRSSTRSSRRARAVAEPLRRAAARASTASSCRARTTPTTSRSWFVYVVKLPDNEARERVIAHFEREAIGFNRYLPSIHLQPYMRERYGFARGAVPGVGGRELAHRSRCRSSPRSSATRRSASPRRSRRRCERSRRSRPSRPSSRRTARRSASCTTPRCRASPRRRSSRAGDRASLPPRDRGDLLRAEGPGPDGGRRRDARVRPGDAVLIPAGAWHTLENNGTSELRILCCCAPPYSHDDTFFS